MTRLYATAELRLAELARANGSVAAMVRGSEVRGLEVRTLAASKLESGLGYWDTSG